MLGMFKAMRTTIRHLPMKIITVQYPEQRERLPERSRGLFRVVIDPASGEPRCRACTLCESNCPVQVIRVNYTSKYQLPVPNAARLGDARRVGYGQLVLARVVDADDLHGAVALAERAGTAARFAAGRVDDHAEEAAAALGQPLALLRVLDGDNLHRQMADRGPHGLEHAEHQAFTTGRRSRWRRRRHLRMGSSRPTNAKKAIQLNTAMPHFQCGIHSMTAAVARMFTRPSGMRTFQAKPMSWSTWRRGSERRIQMSINTRMLVLIRNQMMPIHDTPQNVMALANGPCQPPKNSVTTIIDMMVKPAYSLR